MAPPDGLEPTTYRLTAGCSAIELQGNKAMRLYPKDPITDKQKIMRNKTPINGNRRQAQVSPTHQIAHAPQMDGAIPKAYRSRFYIACNPQLHG
jgi:hypothetical protein